MIAMLFAKSARLTVSLLVAACVFDAVEGADPPGQSEAAVPTMRVLRFRTDLAVGIVETRARRAESYVHAAADDFRRTGEARGDVSVPVDADVRLVLNKVAAKDLSALDSLQPDDVQVLVCNDTELNDEGMQHIGRLTGLRILGLNNVRITADGVRHVRALKQLQEIDLDAFGISEEGFGVGDEALRVLALGRLTELKAIRLRLTKVTDEGMAALSLLKSLESIEIPGTAVTDAGVAHLTSLPRLQSLGLGVYNEGARITDAALAHVGEMKQLRVLDLSGTPITDTGLLSLRGLTRLENLTLDNTKVTNAGLAHLAPLVSLRELRCHIEGHITDEGAKQLSKLRSLRRIIADLSVGEEGVKALAELPELEDLSLDGQNITDAVARHVAKMKSLNGIRLQNCPITDATVALLGGLPKLEVICLLRTRLTGEGLKSLAELPRLDRLYLDFGEHNRGFAGALRHVGELSRLKLLSVRGGGLANEELKSLAELTALETLYVDEMAIDDSGATCLGGLTSLKVLWARGGTLTDAGLEHLSNLRHLEDLRLAGHFTPRGLERLKGAKFLTHVELASPNITQGDVAAFAAAVPSIRSASWYEDRRKGMLHVTVVDKDRIRREGRRENRVELDRLEDRVPPELRVAGWLNAPAEGFSLDRLRGKVVLVEFWDSPRVADAALDPLRRLYEKHHAQGLEIVGIRTFGGIGLLKDVVLADKIPWPVADDVDDATVTAWHANALASRYLIDRTGKLRIARVYRGDLERAIRELLAEE